MAVEGHDAIHAFFYLTIGAVMALAYNMTRWAVVQHTSSLFLAMVGNFKIGALVALSSVLFDEKLTQLNQVGVGITVVAFMAHTYMQKSEKFQAAYKAPEQILPESDADVKKKEARDNVIKIAAQIAVGVLIIGYVVVLLWSLLLNPVIHDAPVAATPAVAAPAGTVG